MVRKKDGNWNAARPVEKKYLPCQSSSVSTIKKKQGIYLHLQVNKIIYKNLSDKSNSRLIFCRTGTVSTSETARGTKNERKDGNRRKNKINGKNRETKQNSVKRKTGKQNKSTTAVPVKKKAVSKINNL